MKYNLSQATHYMYCDHCLGRACWSYRVRCVLLGRTKSGKAKIWAFGYFGRRQDSCGRIRYVPFARLRPIRNGGKP